MFFMNLSHVSVWHTMNCPPLPVGSGSVVSVVLSVYSLLTQWTAFTYASASHIENIISFFKKFRMNWHLCETASLLSERMFLLLIYFIFKANIIG